MNESSGDPRPATDPAQAIRPAEGPAGQADVGQPSQCTSQGTEIIAAPELPAGESTSRSLDDQSERQPTLSAGDTFGGFLVESELGRGEMGIVYQARRLSLERVEALKVIAPKYATDPEYRTRFMREARNAASLDHPHVVRVYDADERDGRLYMAMQYINGVDVRHKLQSGQALPPATAAEITRQVGSALDAAHCAGLIHRDVKPGNILVGGEPGAEHVYLGDFGVSRRFAHPSDVTRPGSVIGTPDYAAPEQHLGKPIDHRADVYSLGCVLFEMLTGRKPYKGETMAAVAIAHCERPIPSARAIETRVPAGLDRVLQTAMAKDPDNRYQSAGELGSAAVTAARDAEDPIWEAGELRSGSSPTDLPAPEPSCETAQTSGFESTFGPTATRRSAQPRRDTPKSPGGMAAEEERSGRATGTPRSSSREREGLERPTIRRAPSRSADGTSAASRSQVLLSAPVGCLVFIVCLLLHHYVRDDSGRIDSLWTATGGNMYTPLHRYSFWILIALTGVVLAVVVLSLRNYRRPLVTAGVVVSLAMVGYSLSLPFLGTKYLDRYQWSYWLSVAASIGLVIATAVASLSGASEDRGR
jgi:serine/threonine protein kinase